MSVPGGDDRLNGLIVVVVVACDILASSKSEMTVCNRRDTVDVVQNMEGWIDSIYTTWECGGASSSLGVPTSSGIAQS